MNHFVMFSYILFSLFAGTNNEQNSNLVGHWALDGNANDQSTFKSDGRIYGNPRAVDGVCDGEAFDFDGDDYIEIAVEGANPPHLKEISTGTISLWFKARSWDINTTILPLFYYGREEPCPEAYDATNEGIIIEIGHGGIFPSRNIFFTIFDQSCAYPTLCFDSNDGKGIIETGKWYHFVAVVGDDYNTGYLNGRELKDRRYNFHSDTASLFFKDALSHDKMWIGKAFWKGKEVYFDGLIDDVRIYNKPLSVAEVKELYVVRR